jgi:HSP20 family molecular chaperone IbpA
VGGLIMRSLESMHGTEMHSGSERPPLDARMDGDDFVAFLQVPGLVEPPTIYAGAERLVVEGLQAADASEAPARRRDRSRPRPFAREIALPPGADLDRLQLEYIAGVLRICIPPRAMLRAV